MSVIPEKQCYRSLLDDRSQLVKEKASVYHGIEIYTHYMKHDPSRCIERKTCHLPSRLTKVKGQTDK